MSGREGLCSTVVAVLPDGVTPVLCILRAGHDEPKRLFPIDDNSTFTIVPGSPHVARVERPA